jgi:hypothetical protein
MAPWTPTWATVQLDIGPPLSLDSCEDTIYSINVAAYGDILLAGALADAGQDLCAVLVRRDSGGAHPWGSGQTLGLRSGGGGWRPNRVGPGPRHLVW